MRHGPLRLATILEAWIRSGPVPDGLARARLAERWPDLVGPRIGAVSRPMDVRGETLLVEVEDPVWRQELSLMQKQILSRISDDPELPRVRTIRFHAPRGGGSTA
jgi:predicted nucleic acid-binding Zn ribbon protein